MVRKMTRDEWERFVKDAPARMEANAKRIRQAIRDGKFTESRVLTKLKIEGWGGGN